MRRQIVDNQEGFTLVEVLVALAVTGLVVGALSSTTWMINNVASRAEIENRARENVIAADRVFRSFVEGAVPDLRSTPPGAAVGSLVMLSLVTLGPSILTFDRPRLMMLEVERRVTGAALVIRWEDSQSGERREQTILERAQSVSLSYFGEERRGTAAWRTQWTQPSRLPKAVLLRIDMPELGPPIDLVARTDSRLPHACMTMPNEPRCGEVK